MIQVKSPSRCKDKRTENDKDGENEEKEEDREKRLGEVDGFRRFVSREKKRKKKKG